LYETDHFDRFAVEGLSRMTAQNPDTTVLRRFPIGCSQTMNHADIGHHQRSVDPRNDLTRRGEE